jgi:hypothetical protein
MIMSTNEAAPSTARRPGVVTFIAVIMYVQAALAAIAGLSLLIWRSDVVDWLEQEGAPLTDGALTGTIIGEFIAAALLFLAAAGLMRGSSGWRVVIAIVQGIAMGFAVYTLIAHHVGGLVYRSVFTLFVGAFVLWALYGNEQSDRFFEENA